MGFGRSLNPELPEERYGIELFTEQVESVRSRFCWRDVILAAVSMVGWTAVNYALENPERVKIRGFVSLYLGPLMLLILGASFWFFGILAQFFGSSS